VLKYQSQAPVVTKIASLSTNCGGGGEVTGHDQEESTSTTVPSVVAPVASSLAGVASCAVIFIGLWCYCRRQRRLKEVLLHTGTVEVEIEPAGAPASKSSSGAGQVER